MTDGTVLPLRPGMTVRGDAAADMAAAIQRRIAKFTDECGEPVAFALVLQSADGTTQPFYDVGPDTPWRGFIALSGAMLTQEALNTRGT